MATSIKIDTVSATQSLRSMNTALRASTNAWKAEEVQAKSVGDYLKASQAKYEGLGRSIDQVKEKIKLIQERQKALDLTTEDGKNSYNRYAKQLGVAVKQLSSMTAQQERAKSAMQYQTSGLASLQSRYRSLNEVNSSYVKRLEAEGKGYEASVAKLNNYRTSLSNLSKQQSIQRNELKRIAEESGITSDAYKKQQVRVNETAASMAKLSSKIKNVKSDVSRYSSGLNELQSKYKSTNSVAKSYVDRLEAEGKKYEAAKTKLNGYKSAVENLTKQQKIQEQELSRIASESGRSSAAYHAQEIKVNQTATSIGKLNSKIKSTSNEVRKLKPTGFNAIANAAKKVTSTSSKMKSTLHSAWDSVKSGATAAAAGIGAVGAAALSGAKKAGNLEQSYKEITNLAVTGGEKQREAIKNVTAMQRQGRDMSIQYGKSQQSIAEAFEDLVKRGYSTKQALGAMRTELQGSVASGDDFEDVVQVSSTTLESFGMRAKSTAAMTRNTKRAVNELAYAADMTSTGFKDLGYGMSYVGSSAHQAGFSLSETASAMGILSNNGLEASKAGTGLNEVINRLSVATGNLLKGDKKNALAKLGIKPKEITDSTGKLKNLSTVFGVINKHMQGMSKVKKINMMKSLFGMTGEQAGLILAKYNKQLGTLSKQTLKAGKDGDYVAKLSAKNSQTAKMQMARLKMAAEAFTMTLGTKMLPAINKAGNELVKFLTKTKDGKKLTKDFANGVGALSNGLVKMIEWIAHHRTETKLIATGLGATYGAVKLAGMIQWINKTRLAFAGLRQSSKIVDSLAGSVGKLFTATKQMGGKGLSGLLTPMHKAGGFKNLTTAGKIGTGIAGAGVVADAGYNAIFKAFKDRHNADKRSQDIGKGIGAGIGGGIGLYFGGPLGAALGSKIGGFIGKWGGEGVNQFTKGWQRQGKKQKPQNWVQWLGFQAHNSLDFFVGLGKKAITAVGKGFNNAKSFAKKNSKELALTAISPLIGIPTLLYKNNPKFKKWADGVGKNITKGFNSAKKGIGNFVKDSGKNISAFNKAVGKKTGEAIKWFHKLPENMHKGWKQGVEKSHKVMAKFWSDTGKGWNKMWKSINSNRYVKAFKKGKLFQTALKDMKSRFKSFKKWFGKNWNATWKSAQKNWKKFSTAFGKKWNSTWKSANKKWNSFKKAFGKAWSKGWKSFNSNRYVKAFRKGKFFQTALKDMKSRWLSFKKWLGKNWNSFWKSTQKWAKSSWNGTVKNWNGMWKSINSGWKSFKSGFGKAWSSFWKGLGNVVKGAVKTIKDDFTGTINNIIGGFNDVVRAMGGKKKTINFLHFANGTDWRKRYGVGVPAIVNDAAGKNYREGLIDTDGTVIPFPAKRNLKWWLMPGQEVINGNDMAKIFNRGVHLANGTVNLSDDHKYRKLVDIAEKQYKLIKKKYDEDKRLKVTKLPIKTVKIPRTTRRKSTLRTSESLSRTTTHREKTSINATVSGLSSVRSLAAAIKSIVGKHTARITVSASSAKSVKALKAAFNKVKSKRIKLSVSGAKSVKSLSSALKGVGKKKTLKGISSASSRLKTLNKRTKSAKRSIKGLSSANNKARKTNKSLTKQLSKTSSKVKSLYKASKKNKFGKEIKSQAEKAVKSLKGKGNFTKTFSSMTKKFGKDLKAMSKDSKKEFKSMWSNIEKASKSGENSVHKSFNSFSSKYKHGWNSLESGVRKAFNHFWSKMQTAAGKGVNDVIKILNSAIGKIDSVISEFGGSKSAVHKSGYVHYASGTDSNGRLTHDTLAIVNDAKSGPRQEAIVTDSNDVILPKGNDVPVMLKKGWGVLNGTQTQQLGLPHYASGTGLKHLYEIAKKNWSHPDKTGSAMFSAVNGLTGAMKELASGMRNQSKKQGVTWWSQLWKMVDDRVNGEGEDLTGLAKHMAKYGHGKPYIWGGESLKGFDCSGLVQYTLAHDYGINLKGRTVGDFWGQVEHIPKSKAKPGDLVFWLPNHHIGAYLGHNQYYSAQSPDNHPNIGVNTLNSVVGEGVPHFGHIKGLSDNDKDKGVKANSALQKLIKHQVWNAGFTKTIDKIRDKYGEANLPNISGSAKSWVSYIKRAAEKMHTSVSSSDVAKIVSMIASESSGNAKVIQKVWDINMANGNPAKGLLQFIPQTFSAFAVSGHHQILNGFDQLLALFNDSNWRNDIHYGGGWGPTGHRRYANGGIVSSPQLAVIGEGNGPETIVPWDITKRAKAYQLMSRTLKHFKQQDNPTDQSGDSKILLEILKVMTLIEKKLDTEITETRRLAEQPINVSGDFNVDGRKFARYLRTYLREFDRQTVVRGRYNLSDR